jgi:sugar phosphate isomerase/epimerase
VPNVKIAIQTRSLRQPLKQALRTAAGLGAAGVEIDARTELRPGELSRTGMRELHQWLANLNLSVSALAFPTRRGYDVAEDLERRVLATQAAMRFARELRADVVINRVGQVPADANDPSAVRMTEALTAIGALGDHVGVRLAAQTAGESPHNLARLLDMLPEQTIGVDLHPTGLIHGGHSPAEAIELLGKHVLHVHACDAVREAAGGRSMEVELGRGMADLPNLIGSLTEFDYRGWITVERREAADPIAEIENAVAYLRSI